MSDQSTEYSDDAFPEPHSLHQDLRIVLNKHSVENGADIPDGILATYLIDCLKALNTTTRRRDKFFGFQPYPETVLEAPNEI